MKKLEIIILILIVAIGGFFRFFKLDWGQGFFFHPDEYHITIAVNRLSFPDQMNPRLFSYGSFSVYLIYFTKLILEKIFFEKNLNIFLVGRFYSALFSTSTLVIVYLISKRLFRKKSHAFLTTGLVALTPGLVQQAHFATPESNLTFFIFLSVYLLIKYLDSKQIKHFYFSALFMGVASGVKITALLLTPVLLFSLFFEQTSIKQFTKRIKNGILGVLIFLTAFFLVFPYSFLDYKGFQNSMKYESSVASGGQVVFYTRQFLDTTPILFQLEKILPYALGPSILLLGVSGFLIILRILGKGLISGQGLNPNWFIITTSFIFFFIPNSFLYAKWTRFIAPTFPFFAIFSIYAISKLEKRRIIFHTLILTLTLTTLVWMLMFFSIYLRNDVRQSATLWAKENLPQNSYILTEQGNTFEVPLSGRFNKIPFDFYHLDENPELPQKLIYSLEESDYFIIQSRRIYMNHKDKNLFPITKRFYKALFSNELGFEKIKEFDSYPSLANVIVVEDESAEETWSVFDHPVIRIYKKVTHLSQKDYEEILGI